MKIRIFALALLCLATSGAHPGLAAQNYSDKSLRLSSALLGTPISGVTLSGPLAGKTMYMLPASVNPPHCWKDSAFWDGQELIYGITSISWTRLVGSSPAYTPDPGCALPSDQTTPGFNIYSAVPAHDAWQLTRLSFNDNVHPFAGEKMDNNLMAFVSYEKGDSNLGNIYLTNRTGPNAWSAPLAFEWNSKECKDDNPDLYDNGTKMIFESNRVDPAATSCTPDHQKLWTSTLLHGKWSEPTLIAGTPNNGGQSFQPWLDEKAGSLYWTGENKDCGNNAMNCVMSASAEGRGWNGPARKIIIPSPLIPGATNGKVVMVGEYSEANNYAFLVCATANETDPSGKTPTLLDGRWSIDFNVCVIPLN